MDNLLSIVTFIPALAALILAVFLRGEDVASQRNAKWLALLATGATFLVSLFILAQFDPQNTGFQFVEEREWLLGLKYRMGVDGISVLFVMLTTFMMPLVIAASWDVTTRVKEYMIAFLLLETLMLGVFMALDLVLFYVFFEAVLIPMFLIIGIWGGKDRIYAAFNRNRDKLMFMDPRSAELTKYAANAMLATKISFINEVANIAETVGADIELVRQGIGSDPRIGYQFIYPGAGYGGSCFPKDTKGLVSAADKFKINLSVVKSVIKSNHERINLLTQRIHKILGSNLKNKRISFLGVTFKPNTDDMRDSTSLKMIPYLCKKGAKVTYYDPSGEKNEFRKIKNCNYRNNIKSNCNGADLVILLTEWDEFKSIDFKKIVKNNKFKVYDLRNLYSAEEMKKNKIKYYSIGRPNTN